jgi:hypothetical protein
VIFLVGIDEVVTVMLILEADECFSCKFGQSEGRSGVQGKLFAQVDKLLIEYFDLIGDIGHFFGLFDGDIGLAVFDKLVY